MPTGNFPGASRSAEARASGMSGGANPLQEYKNITRGVKGGQDPPQRESPRQRYGCGLLGGFFGIPTFGKRGKRSHAGGGFCVQRFRSHRNPLGGQEPHLVYREDSTTKMTMPNTNTPINMTQARRVETFTVNEPVSPDVFTFTPPPGAREIDESKFLRKTAEVPQKKNESTK